MHSEKITKRDMKVAIRRSGYLIEQRVSQLIHDHGYHVEANPSFVDPVTGKSREYDTSAVITFDLLDRKEEIDFLWFHILCECENNEQPIVFFKNTLHEPDLMHQGVICSGLPLRFPVRRGEVTLSQFLQFEEFHHAWKWPLATQYCSFHRKNLNAPWVALHEEAHHGTIAGLLAALECEVDEHYRLLRTEGLPRTTTSISVYYPTVVVGGELHLAWEARRGLRLLPVKYVQFKKESSMGGRRRTHLIDIIQEAFLPHYLVILERERETMRKRARSKKNDILTALEAQVSRLRAARTGAEIRGLCDPGGR
jgi:hypothetical protein